MQRIFITGANRGIGLELTRQTLLRGDRVFAATRQPENAIDLQELKVYLWRPVDHHQTRGHGAD